MIKNKTFYRATQDIPMRGIGRDIKKNDTIFIINATHSFHSDQVLCDFIFDFAKHENVYMFKLNLSEII